MPIQIRLSKTNRCQRLPLDVRIRKPVSGHDLLFLILNVRSAQTSRLSKSPNHCRKIKPSFGHNNTLRTSYRRLPKPIERKSVIYLVANQMLFTRFMGGDLYQAVAHWILKVIGGCRNAQFNKFPLPRDRVFCRNEAD